MKINAVKICLALGMTMTLVSCGATAEQTLIEENILRADQITTEYEIVELGEYNYKLYDSYGEIYTIMDDKGQIGYLNNKGEILAKPQFSTVSYGDGLVTINPVIDSSEPYYYYAELDGTPVIEDVEGKKIITAGDFKDGYAIVELENQGNSNSYLPNTVIDKQGNIVISVEAVDTFISRDKEGRFIVYNTNSEFIEAYNEDGSKIPESDLANIENYDGDDIIEENGLYITTDNEFKSAIYDINKDEVISEYRLMAYPISKVGENYFIAPIVDDKIKIQIIDSTGNLVKDLTTEYGNINNPVVVGDKIILNFKDEKNAIILDENGEVYKETNASYVFQTLEGTTICMVNNQGTNQYGYMDHDFNVILKPEYDNVSSIYNGVGVMQKGNKFYQFIKK